MTRQKERGLDGKRKEGAGPLHATMARGPACRNAPARAAAGPGSGELRDGEKCARV